MPPENVADRLRRLGPKDIVIVGQVLDEALAAWPEATGRFVVVTGERRIHYLERHQDVADDEDAIVDLIRDPSEIRRYERDPDVANLYRRIDDAHSWMVAVLIAKESPLLNSVLSFRRARRRAVERGKKRGLVVWKK